MLVVLFFVIPVTGVFISLVKKFAHREFVRACARSIIMVMLASREPHFGKIMPTYKSAYRLYFASKVDAKNIAEMPRKLPFKWCYFWLEMLASTSK